MIKTSQRQQPSNEFDTTCLSEFAPLSSDVKPSGGFFSRWLRKPGKQNSDDAAAETQSAPPTPPSKRRAAPPAHPHPPYLVNALPARPPSDLRLAGAKTELGKSSPGDDQSDSGSTGRSTPTAIPRPDFTGSMRLTLPHQHSLTGSGRHTPTSGQGASQAGLTASYSAGQPVVPQSRNLSSVLRRLNSILDRKGLAYKDSDFKQYWMPDDTCNECYECGDKFTTFRRRHHCRICGQIFCSRCCNQEVPGRIFGYKGDLRVCTYCCRVVLSYAQQTDASGDLRSLREDLKSLANIDSGEGSAGSYQEFQRWTPGRRKTSQFTEEETGRPRSSSLPDAGVSALPIRNPFDITPQTEYRSMVNINNERRVLTQDSVQLRELWLCMTSPEYGITMTSHRLRLRTYNNCFTGQNLVDWLINMDKVTSRDQGCAIGQALFDAKLIESISGLDVSWSIRDMVLLSIWLYGSGLSMTIRWKKITFWIHPLLRIASWSSHPATIALLTRRQPDPTKLASEEFQILNILEFL